MKTLLTKTRVLAGTIIKYKRKTYIVKSCLDAQWFYNQKEKEYVLILAEVKY